MKMISRFLVFILIASQVVASFAHNSYAYEDNTERALVLSNGFVELSINKDNGRFSIATESGAAHRNDQNQPLLFEEYVPDTSFTTFRIDGEDYIFGNDYGFLGSISNFKQQPTTTGLVNETIWVIRGVEITQTLVLDTSAQNAGSIKISYHVQNDTNSDVQIGSRILLDTMLGINDGAPLTLPGSQSFIEKETQLSGEEIPAYWKSVNNVLAANVVAYGLVSGWRNQDPLRDDLLYNTKPDEMIIGHWEGLSKTKWAYTVNPMLNFTSPNNVHGSRDSAIALLWSEESLKTGGERVYETFYGLGEFATVESETPVNMKLSAPERLYLNDAKDGYNMNTVTVMGDIENNLVGSQRLMNAKVTISYDTAGLAIPFGRPKTINLGTVNADTISSFSWELNTSPMYSWTYFRYAVTLTADNLSEPIVREGDILIPSISGEPPEIKFTDFRPRNLYFLDDEKLLTITGENLNAIATGGDYRVMIKSKETGAEHIVTAKNLKLESSSITVSIPKDLKFEENTTYEVKIEYIAGGEQRSHTLAGDLVLSSNKKYMIRKYGILLVVREEIDGRFIYKLVEAKNESELKKLSKKEAVILDIRAGEIIKTGDIYTINSETVTINSIVTAHWKAAHGDDPMTIEARPPDWTTGNDNFIFITGKGKLEIPGFAFQNGPYEMKFVDGDFYSVTDEEDAKDVAIKIPLLYKGFPVAPYSLIVAALPIDINEAILRENAISFGGGINMYALLNGPSELLTDAKKDKDKKKGDDKKDEDDDDDFDAGFALNIDDLRFGINEGIVALQGLKADGMVGLPAKVMEKVIPGANLGAEIAVSIDTFDDWRFSFKADIKFEVIEADGEIVFKVLNLGGFPIPIPDTVKIYGQVEPGVPLIPVAPVGFLIGLGGGFSELYDTIALNFNFLPPLTLHAYASLQLFKIFEANKIFLDLSARGFTIGVEKIKIGPLDIFRNIQKSLTIKDDLINPGFEAKVSAELNIKDWITGDAQYVFIVDMALDGPLGPVSIAGRANCSIQIPKGTFLIGGQELGNAGVEISTESVFAGLSVIRIPFSIKYEWGGATTLRLFANAAEDGQYLTKPLIHSEVFYDEQGQPKAILTIGDNFHVVSDSRSKFQLASLSDDLSFLAGIDTKEHIFNIQNHDYTLIEVSYSGERPSLNLYDPDGTKVELEENVSLLIQEAPADAFDTLSKAFISIVNPANGDWKLTSSKPVDTRLIRVDAIPEITEVNGTLSGKSLTVNWSGKEITNETVTVLLTTDKGNDPGTIIASGLTASSGTATIDLPHDLTSGNYYVRVQLVDSDGTGLSTVDSAASISYENLNQPSSVTNMNVSNIGNAFLDVTWDKQGTADGYWIDVFDVEDGKRVSSFNILENEGENIIGGTFNQIHSLSENDVTKAGMIPGKRYRISVSAYNLKDGIEHSSTPATQEITISVPSPATISYGLSSSAGRIIDKGINENVQTYLTKEQSIALSLSSDEQVQWKVTVNNEVVYNETATNPIVNIDLVSEVNNIGIEAVNSQGDLSEDGLVVNLDRKAPVLRIDSPKQGDLVNDVIIVSGFVDLNSNLLINGVEVVYDNDGLFNYEIPMDGKMLQTIRVEAIDEALNKSEYFAEVYNSSLKDIKEIKIQPNIKQILIGGEVDYNVYIVDKENNEFLLDDSVVKWSTLNNYGVFEVNQDGKVNAYVKGKDVLIASFQIAEDFAFEDAIIIEVVDELQWSTSVIPPSLLSRSHNRIALVNLTDYEYIKVANNANVSTGIWQDSNVFTGLSAGTPYDFYQRVKATATRNASEISTKLDITTRNRPSNEEDLVEDSPIHSVTRAFENAELNSKGQLVGTIEIKNANSKGEFLQSIPLSYFTKEDKLLKVVTPIATVTLPDNMFTDLPKGKIELSITEVPKDELPEEVREQIGDKPVISINILVNGKKTKWENDNTYVEIAIPYTPTDEELKDPNVLNKIIAVYIDDDGNIIPLTFSNYDPERGAVVLRVNHFSYYGVQYVDKDFVDTGRYTWAEDAIATLAARGVINGISEKEFAPQKDITRADFVVLIARFLELDGEFTENFSDVNEETYYYNAVGVAREMGIVTGTGNNEFKPLQAISRQDMMVIITRGLKITGNDIKLTDSSGRKLSAFDDKDEVASYARESVEFLIEKGIVNGDGKNINPRSHTKRAEVAVLLNNLLNVLSK
ncbi:MAG: S-layer homology domain-containing protein [Alkaliphilus sp.]